MDGESLPLLFGGGGKNKHVKVKSNHQKGAESSMEAQFMVETTMARSIAD